MADDPASPFRIALDSADDEAALDLVQRASETLFRDDGEAGRRAGEGRSSVHCDDGWRCSPRTRRSAGAVRDVKVVGEASIAVEQYSAQMVHRSGSASGLEAH